VNDIKDLGKETDQMVSIGYECYTNYIAPNTLVFFRTGEGQQKFENIHVCEKGVPKVRQFIVMRDFFKAFPDKAKEYSELKKKNFLEYPEDYPAYRSAKAAFLEQVEAEAYKWDESREIK
jgi:GrpB-like predicted nucleotidyltransferase (UPF0157 family)